MRTAEKAGRIFFTLIGILGVMLLFLPHIGISVDANNREDPTVVTADQIIGKVIFSLPCLGYAAVFVRQRTIFGILTVMILQEMFFLLIQWKGERSRKSAERIYEK